MHPVECDGYPQGYRSNGLDIALDGSGSRGSLWNIFHQFEIVTEIDDVSNDFVPIQFLQSGHHGPVGMEPRMAELEGVAALPVIHHINIPFRTAAQKSFNGIGLAAGIDDVSGTVRPGRDGCPRRRQGIQNRSCLLRSDSCLLRSSGCLLRGSSGRLRGG